MLYDNFERLCSLIICIVISSTIIACDNGDVKKSVSNNTVVVKSKNIVLQNPEVDECLNNIGMDVVTKNFSANTFSGNKCGVIRFGNGISLNIYNSFYQQNLADKEYILYKLNSIASKYEYNSYSILISDNENKLMIDREIEKHQIHK